MRLPGLPASGKILVAPPAVAAHMAELAEAYGFADRIYALPGLDPNHVFVVDLDRIAAMPEPNDPW